MATPCSKRDLQEISSFRIFFSVNLVPRVGCKECLSTCFQRLLPTMRKQLRDSLADGLGEHVLPHLDEVGRWGMSGVCQVSVETPPCSTGGRTVKLDLFLIKLG